MPSSLQTIGNYAFRNCVALSEVAMNEQLVDIGDYAFKSYTSLKSVTIPANVTTIGGWAFEDCSALVKVCCNAVEPPTLGYDAFDDNGAGRTICVPEASVESYKKADVWSDYAASIVAQTVE